MLSSDTRIALKIEGGGEDWINGVYHEVGRHENRPLLRKVEDGVPSGGAERATMRWFSRGGSGSEGTWDIGGVGSSGHTVCMYEMKSASLTPPTEGWTAIMGAEPPPTIRLTSVHHPMIPGP